MKRTILGGLIILVCLVLFAFIFPSGFLFNLFTQILIMGLFASSLNLLIGYTGMVSFGHAAFFGLGAYTAGILLQKFTSSLLLTLFSTVLISTVAALIIGFFCIRLGSIYFAMLTLAFNQIVYIIIVRWTGLTGGDQGLIGGIPIPPLNFFGVEIILSNPRAFFILTAFIVITCLVFCKLMVDSPFGAILRVVRENADRAYALGIRVKSYQLIVFVVAGVLGGLSGGLMALFISGAYPDFAYWAKSAEPIFMVIVGGMNSFLGPMLGAGVFTVLISVSTMYTNLWGLIIGSVLVLIILLARKGLADYLVELLYGMGLLKTPRNASQQKNG
jgi:branched-chain amino acid transport system permease protein